MTYTELAAQHEAELNRPDKVSMTQQWIEDAYRDIMSRRKFRWLFAESTRNTKLDEYRYALPADFYALTSLVFKEGTANSWRLNIYSPEEFDTLHPNVLEDSPDRPEDGCVVTSVDPNYVSFSELVVWPRANSADYEFVTRYEVIAPALSGVLVPLIPPRYHQAIVFGSLSRGFANLREYEAALYWEKKYEGFIARMIEDDKYLPSRPTVMQPFNGAQNIYPPDYWKKYTIRGIR